MFSLSELASYISMSEIPDSWKNCKQQIDDNYTEDWLDLFDFEYMISFYEFDDDFKKRFIKEVQLLNKDNKLNYLCYLMYYILYKADAKNYYNIWSWKSPSSVFKDNGSYMIPVVALLCGYKVHIENINLRNYDDEQIRLQKYNIRLTCTSDQKRFNMDGIRFSQMIWGSFFIKGNLIQIGRLQYEIGVKNFSKIDKYFSEPHVYIYIHIPARGRLEYDEVKDSLNAVSEYIKRYYKELDDKLLAYYTQSWLLSPEVAEIIPEDSNIMKFQNLFNIIEHEENLDDFLNFIFNEPNEVGDYSLLRENTSLQRELKKRLLNGDKLHLGLGFIK
ncbi:MAG: hypothetical protein J1F35_03840 [Erysipelotrichales bacterium]|nr:hypothetical protein [Erysipelotrichales bacterium]